MKHQSHWGLRESPFQGNSLVQMLRQSPVHEEALARLQFLVENHRRLGLLTGPSGSGKSLLLEAFAGHLRRHGQPVVHISLLGIGPTELLWLLAAELKLNPAPSELPFMLWRSISDRLVEFYYEQLQAVVLLDDVESADSQVITQVARLARHDTTGRSRLTLVLAGQKEKMDRLGEQLLDLAELRIGLELWSQSDTAGVLKSLLAKAGCKSQVFSDSAIDKLHELTHGVPRRAVQLADLSLLAGAGAELKQIDADVVESVYHELATADA
jgi:general secretion pathway protein A